MTENKTKPTVQSVAAYLEGISDAQSRADCFALVELMQAATGAEPVMWGTSIIGFGTRHYVYESGRQGDTVIIGFSPRKQNIAIYLMGGLDPLKDELSELGKYSTGKGCLYIKRLKDVNPSVLKKIFSKSFNGAQETATE